MIGSQSFSSYQGVRSVDFAENMAYVPNEWPPKNKLLLSEITELMTQQIYVYQTEMFLFVYISNCFLFLFIFIVFLNAILNVPAF